jgi:hypothetical protein
MQHVNGDACTKIAEFNEKQIPILAGRRKFNHEDHGYFNQILIRVLIRFFTIVSSTIVKGTDCPFRKII